MHVKDLDATRENILPVGEGTLDYQTHILTRLCLPV
jgi:hypothetical protein